MVKKSEFLWNSIASIIASALSAVLLLFATRMNGSEQAGMFAITFATATILNAIGDFGMRVFQVTDTKRKYSFWDYLNARIIVALIMVITAVLFVALNGYGWDKALLCILFVLYRFMESISETYQGELQLRQKLDVAAKSVVYRNCGAILVFFIIDLITGNMMLSVCSMIIWAIVIAFSYDIKKIRMYITNSWGFRKDKVISLIMICFPTFFSTLLNLYIINAPKYAIDNVMNYGDQTIFNVIFLPTFTINLMSIFILKPLLLSMGTMWNENRHQDFKKIIYKMVLLISVVTGVVEIICYFIGIPMLTMIYGLDLTLYKTDLLILIVSGGFSALAVMFFYALTTMRCQKEVSIPYILSGLTALFICEPLVIARGIQGAAISSVIITFVLFFVSMIIVVWKLYKKHKEIA